MKYFIRSDCLRQSRQSDLSFFTGLLNTLRDKKYTGRFFMYISLPEKEHFQGANEYKYNINVFIIKTENIE